MTGRRWALAMTGLALLGAGTLGLVGGGEDRSAERPALMLLTSLPILFGEGFSLDQTGSPLLAALERRYRPVPISVSSGAELSRGRLLLMAHSAAQTPENLVALDHWVRSGGRILLLADPALEWPSERPLGDPLRPSPMFMDTGLLAHWGLRLETPETPGETERTIGGRTVTAVSPGRLSGRCMIDRDGFVARCRIGKGRAVVVADADFLEAEHRSGEQADSSAALVAELVRLESRGV